MTLQWLGSGTRMAPKCRCSDLRSMVVLSRWCCRGTIMAWQLYGSGAIVAVVLSWQLYDSGAIVAVVLSWQLYGSGVIMAAIVSL